MQNLEKTNTSLETTNSEYFYMVHQINLVLAFVGTEEVPTKGAFSLHWAPGPPRTRRSLRFIWRRTLDPRPIFIPNRSVGRAIPDYCVANQWCRTRVSEMTTILAHNFKRKWACYSTLSLQVASLSQCLTAVSPANIAAKSNNFSFPMILVWDRKRVNVARYSVEGRLIGLRVERRTHFVSGRQTVGRPRELPRSIERGLFTPFLGGRTSGPRRTIRLMEKKSVIKVFMPLNFNLKKEYEIIHIGRVGFR